MLKLVMHMLRALPVLAALSFAIPAVAQDAVVTRNVTVREAPIRGAEKVEYVVPGDTLELLDDGQKQNRYLHVRLEDGREGWVYQTFVRIDAVEKASAAVSPTEFKVHFIDVDQGNAMLLEFPCAAMLIDVGGRGNDAAMHLLGYSRAFFDRRADLGRRFAAVMITHTHIDHNSNLKRLIDGRYLVGSYVHNGILNGSGRADARWMASYVSAQSPQIKPQPITEASVEAAGAGGLTNDAIDPVKCPAVDPQIHILAGGRSANPGWSLQDFKNGNNQSLVIRIDFGKASFLFPGDLENAGIEDLLRRYRGTGMLNVDVLAVSHHGADNGTTDQLLSEASPQIAVISMGPESIRDPWTAYAYGHPRSTTVNRLINAVSGSRPKKTVAVAAAVKKFSTIEMTRAIYATGWDGDIVVSADVTGRLAVQTSR